MGGGKLLTAAHSAGRKGEQLRLLRLEIRQQMFGPTDRSLREFEQMEYHPGELRCAGVIHWPAGAVRLDGVCDQCNELIVHLSEY